MKKTWILLLLLLCAGCREDGRQAGTVQTGNEAPSRPAQKMQSLKITGPETAASKAAPANSQSLSVRGGASGVQIQGGSGNTQTMNVNASGGNVTQRQSGSGNTQSMNIGVVDGVSEQGGAVPRNQ